MRDMSAVYFKLSSESLRALRSKKVVRRENLRSHYMGYLDQQELRMLNAQIKWIDAVLASRDQQMRLFE